MVFYSVHKMLHTSLPPTLSDEISSIPLNDSAVLCILFFHDLSWQPHLKALNFLLLFSKFSEGLCSAVA